jgi:hypothetical protein
VARADLGVAASIARMLIVAVAMLAAHDRAVAQQELPSSGIPDAPTPKQEQSDSTQKPANTPLRNTIQVLGKRSMFFPELAFDKGRLDARQKLELAVDETVAPSRFLGSAFTAGIGQARDSLPGYGQEWGGYGKRMGSSTASNASSHLFGTFLLPSALHQDPRYFVKLYGTAAQRVGYAVSRVVVTRTDAGGKAFNWSGFMSGLMAEALANSYLPSGERTTGKTFSRFGFRIGFGALDNVVKEYWPTIFRSLRIGKLAPSERSDPGTVTPPTGPPAPPQPH